MQAKSSDSNFSTVKKKAPKAKTKVARDYGKNSSTMLKEEGQWVGPEAKDRLRRHEKLAAMGASAAVLAHEMGNELNTIWSATQLIERHMSTEIRKDDEVVSLLPQLKKGLEQLCSLLNAFRTLGQPQELRLRPTDLVGVINELIATVKTQYLMQGVRIQFDFRGNAAVIATDRQKLKQALFNLFKNAVEAMPAGGVLTIRLHRRPMVVRIEIQDTGVGIPDHLDVFEPFATTKSQGSGIGLTFVQQVVSAHGGTLAYESGPDRGTTFHLTLPIAATETSDKKRFVCLGWPQTALAH